MRFRRILKTFSIILIMELLTGLVGFYLFVYSSFPVFTGLRTLWIETAMTTMTHQWLATTFFPQETINEVMGKQVVDFEGIGGLDLDLPEADQKIDPESPKDPITLVETEDIDILGQKSLEVGGEDWAGNTILVNDIEQGIVISQVKSKNYNGWAIIIDDPSRIRLAATSQKEQRGQQILEIYEKENAIFACNASGFYDPGGSGNGGTVTGRCFVSGESWGKYTPSYVTLGFDWQNRFVVGTFENWEDYGIRDACQFSPALIINGEQLISGTAGWGLQPRTTMGQRADGTVVFLVVDGRQPGYSTGIAMGQCADILFAYGCVNAAACDGGSSSVFAYNGEVWNRSSSPQRGGRNLPNAWVVDRKELPVSKESLDSSQDILQLEPDPLEPPQS